MLFRVTAPREETKNNRDCESKHFNEDATFKAQMPLRHESRHDRPFPVKRWRGARHNSHIFTTSSGPLRSNKYLCRPSHRVVSTLSLLSPGEDFSLDAARQLLLSPFSRSCRKLELIRVWAPPTSPPEGKNGATKKWEERRRRCRRGVSRWMASKKSLSRLFCGRDPFRLFLSHRKAVGKAAKGDFHQKLD